MSQTRGRSNRKLRRARAEDLDDLLALDNDPDVMHWINGGLTVTRERYQQHYLPNFLDVLDNLTGFWIIEHEHRFVGWVSVVPDDKRTFKLGYRLVKDVWGQGIATEVCRMMIHRVQAESAAAMIEATTYEENVGSQKVLEKLGFKLIERFRLTAEALESQATSESEGDVWEGDEFLYRLELPRS